MRVWRRQRARTWCRRRRWQRCTGCKAAAPGAQLLPGPAPPLHHRL